ncbi:CRISPR-associated protein Cas4 [Amphibacillus jilinensis]|uniref:CRISPR-associated protein Cas4 n=1 Tax=Amphibacillus jilinensis TaxID=1216008 RepID=UPI0002EFB20C|nr:CRISPR-associated protein Cas4 [Amphibacillus jilinensis]
MDNNPEEYLMLSGIQHYEFCPRQWALIHIEQQWEENVRTVQGQHLHRNADQPFIREKRGERIIVRAMPIHSNELQINGICDVVEFVKDSSGVYVHQLQGYYRAFPVEYKRGKPKKNDADILQLAAQAICLEEMLLCKIDTGYLFYNEIKRRVEVPIADSVKDKVHTITAEMHKYFKRKHTPKVKTGPFCQRCSLKNICLPKLMKKETVHRYIERKLKE